MLDDMWNFVVQLLNAAISVRTNWFFFSLFVFAIASGILLYGVPLILPDGVKAAKTETPAPRQHDVLIQQSVPDSRGAPKPNNTPIPSREGSPVQQTALVQRNSSGQQLENPVSSVINTPNVQIGHIAQDGTHTKQISIGNTTEKKRDIIGGFHLTAQPESHVTINVHNSFDVEKTAIQVKSDTGGQAQIEIYMLFNSASWSYGSSSKVISHQDGALDLMEFLDSKEFSDAAEQYKAIVCLGLASGAARGDIRRTLDLADERATHLCGLISRKAYIDSQETKIFGLPLGYNNKINKKKNTLQERKQRSLVILGIKATSGTLNTDDERRKMIFAILKEDGLEGFRSSDYSEVASGEPLKYMRIERGIFSAR